MTSSKPLPKKILYMDKTCEVSVGILETIKEGLTACSKARLLTIEKLKISSKMGVARRTEGINYTAAPLWTSALTDVHTRLSNEVTFSNDLQRVILKRVLHSQF